MTENQQLRQRFWLRLILIYCLVLLLILVLLTVWENQKYTHTLTTEDYAQLPSASTVYLVNLNEATLEELQDLPRIGPVLAGEIIAYREANGGFSDTEELLKVKGIGQTTYDALVSLITV